MNVGPTPFVSWHCDRCDCGSGSVILAAGSAGDDVRDAAIEHTRTVGCTVTFIRGTVEMLGVSPEQRLTGAVFGVDPQRVTQRPRLREAGPRKDRP